MEKLSLRTPAQRRRNKVKERRWRGGEELLITAAVGNAKKVLILLMALSKLKILQ
jgi:hypothetical protein